jgi:hypothetical protein
MNLLLPEKFMANHNGGNIYMNISFYYFLHIIGAGCSFYNLADYSMFCKFSITFTDAAKHKICFGFLRRI